jgi:large subunit ribosomal protein L22
MKVSVKTTNLRISPRKVRLVANLIRGLDVEKALIQVDHTIKKACPAFEKLLKSAVANAENNFGLDKDNLYVQDVQVGDGQRMKRWMPRAFGRATPIIKRASHIYLILEERVEGKNRKSKEQMEKEKKEREISKKKAEKEMIKEREERDEEEKKSEKVQTKKETQEREVGQKKSKGWASKVFNRKSM